MEKLNTLASLITAVIGDFATLRDSGKEHFQMLQNRGGEVEKELLALRAEGLDSLKGVASHTQTINEIAAEISQLCESDPEVEKRFEGARLCLEETAALFGLVASRIKHSSPTDKEAGWRDQYTMASERDVHAAVIGATPVKSESMVEHAAANTELFESLPPLPVEPAEKQNGSNVPVSADLGANVDLF